MYTAFQKFPFGQPIKVCQLYLTCHCLYQTTEWKWYCMSTYSLQWRQNGRDSVSNHQPNDCLFSQQFIQTQIKENTKAPRHWPLCGKFTGTGEFPAQRVSNADDVSIWWRHHGLKITYLGMFSIKICFCKLILCTCITNDQLLMTNHSH